MRLLEALDKSETSEGGGTKTGQPPKWINVEIRRKKGEKYKTITPIRIPYPMVKLFFRFIPADSHLTGETSIEDYLADLEKGKALELASENEGMAIRITAE